MNIDYLSEQFKKQGFKVAGITLLEDGYEVRLKMISDAQDDYLDTSDFFRNNMKNLETIDYRGLVVIDYCIRPRECTLLLVPKSMEEMTDFIWKYVEKYGKRNQRLVRILSDAVCVLEKAIERIPIEYNKDKLEAQTNYDSFTRMIF